MSKIKFLGKAKVIDDKYVLKKEKEKSYLFNYLKSRDFNYFLEPIDRSEEAYKYPYIEDYSVTTEQKGEDLAETLGILHSKTAYYKKIDQKTYLEIYNNLNGYINYVNDYYEELLSKCELKVFPSPSELLFLTNYSKLKELNNFLKEETKNWYASVKDQTEERIALNHGNVDINHLLKGNERYLISWDNYHFDSPIADIINFYHNNWDKINFNNALKVYQNRFSLTNEELKLMIINICIPELITLNDKEINNTIEVTRLFNYIKTTEDLIRPYYTKENKEE